MTIKITNANDALKMGITHSKILIFSNSGVGKTWLSATAPKPLIILTEANGAVSAGHSNPEADIVIIKNMNDLREVMLMAKVGELDNYQTLVFDSLTEIQRLFKDEIQGDSNQFQLQQWSTLTYKMTNFIRMIRQLPFHIVCTCLSDRQTDENGTVTLHLPQFQGKKTAGEIMQYFSAVGYYFTSYETIDDQQVLTRKLMFEGSERWAVKPCYPLTNMSNPNMTEIINSIVTGEIERVMGESK